MIGTEQWRASTGLYHSGSYRRLARIVGKRRRPPVTAYRLLWPLFSVLSLLVQTLFVVWTWGLYMLLVNGYSLYKGGLTRFVAFKKRTSVSQLLVCVCALSITIMEDACANLERSLVARAILLIMSGDVEQNPGPIRQKDIKTASEYLSPLTQNDLLLLGIQLGLYPKTLQGYGNVPLANFRILLLCDWVNEKDNVKECGGATWSSLVNALRSEEVSQNGIAAKIEAEQMESGQEEQAGEADPPPTKQAKYGICEAEQESAGKTTHPTTPLSSTPLSEYIDYLKAFYDTDLPTYNKWPPTPSKKYINLAVINREETSQEHRELITLATLHGNIDQVREVKAPLDISEILDTKAGEKLQCVLVEGAPGVGKTTFAWEICKRWAKGELFQQYAIVLLLILRDEAVQKAKCITDLIFYQDESYKQEISKYLSHNPGKDMFIILEGLDELPKQHFTQSSIFHHLLSRSIFPQATILITSRPFATVQLWKDWKHRISRHIEVLGFTEQDISEYITSVMSPNEYPGFNEYLSLNPTIKLLMYIPIHAAIVIEVYRCCHKSSRCLPTTATKLYTCLVQTILSRYLDSHPDYEHQYIKKFTDLPPPVYEHFEKLMKLAFEGVMCQQLTFLDQDKQIEHLGFMNTITEYFPYQRPSYTYNFLHLSVQEYLAAYFVSLMSTEEQEALLATICSEQHLENVGKFLAGITKFKDLDRTTVQAIFEQEFEDIEDGESTELTLQLSPYILQLVHESGDCSIIKGYSTYSCVLEESSPSFHFFVLGYCIANSSYNWILVLGHKAQCMQSTEGVSMLVQTLKRNSNPTYTIEYMRCYYDSPQCVEHLLVELPPNALLQIQDLSLFGNCMNHQPLPQCVLELITSKIQSLQLRNGAVSADGAATISKALHSNSILTVLDISENNLNDNDATAIATALNNNGTLTTLWISKNNFSACGTTAIAKALCSNSTLTKLYIDGNDISVSGAAAIATALHSNTTLTVLNISTCANGAIKFAKALHKNSTLTTLHFNGNGNSITTRGAIEIAKALQSNNTLTQLYIHGNNISDSGATAIATALQSNVALIELDISDNDISNIGASAIAKALHSNGTLAVLDISNNVIGDGAIAISTALCDNSTLTDLNISHNKIGDSGAIAIIKALKCNNTLLKLTMSHNDITNSGNMAILRELQAIGKVVRQSLRGGSGYGLNIHESLSTTKLLKGSSIIHVVHTYTIIFDARNC